MELAKLIKPLKGKRRTEAKKDLLKSFNQAVSEALEDIRQFSYGKIQPDVYAIGINISDKPLIYRMKKDIEDLGFAQTANLNEYQNFINSAFEDNKLCLKCTNSKINKDYAVNKKTVQIRTDDDPRLFNPDVKDSIQVKIQFHIIPLTPKSKKKVNKDNNSDGYTPYRG